MKIPRFSLRFLLASIAVLALMMALDQNLDSKVRQLRNKIDREYADLTGAPMEAVGLVIGGTKGIEVEEMTNWTDRILLRRRLNATFVSFGSVDGAVIETSFLKRQYFVGTLGTRCEEKR